MGGRAGAEGHAVTDDVRRDALALLRRLRFESGLFDTRLGLAGLGRTPLDVFGAASEALRRRGYYVVPMPQDKSVWLQAIDGAIADLEGGDDARSPEGSP